VIEFKPESGLDDVDVTVNGRLFGVIGKEGLILADITMLCAQLSSDDFRRIADKIDEVKLREH
jgi:hypothetical protein